MENLNLPDVSPDAVFYGVQFAIIRSDALDEEYANKLQQLLESNGALHIPARADGRLDDLLAYTHIISTTTDFPDYHKALDQMSNVVRPDWVEHSIAKKKAVNARQYSPDPALFLSDVVVTCAADIPEGDVEAIMGGCLAMGGQFSPVLTKLVTHIITLGLNNEKCAIAIEKNLKCHILLPHWFDDCLKLGKRLNEQPYLLPDPPILKANSGKAWRYEGTSKEIEGATCPVAYGYPTPLATPSQQREELSIFHEKRVMLSGDLNIGERLQATIEDLILAGRGSVTKSVEECDIYVCHYRDGPDYIQASRLGKEVGNLVWLYYMITHNHWTSPYRRLLHYPIPRNGIPGFKDFRISVTNYSGDARLYLENLIKAAGAEFTRAMRQDNTHLIAGHTESEKCDAAKEWNINVVNHLWIEESYAKCELQTLTDRKYTYFPKATNLGSIVGQTQIDRDAVEKHYFPQPKNTLRDHEVYREHLDRTNGALEPRKRKASSQPASSVIAPSEAPSGTNGATEGDGTPAHRTLKKARKSEKTATPARLSVDKENVTPPTTGSRGAKERALNKLHNLAPDIAAFEKETKRKGGVVYGGRKVTDEERVGNDKAKAKESKQKKRPLEEEEQIGDEDELQQEEVTIPKGTHANQAKKRKTAGPTYRMMISGGDERWAGAKTREAKDKQLLRKLGVQYPAQPDACNLFVAPAIKRTKKFIMAVANGAQIVTTKWLDDLLDQGEIPDVADYLLEDPENEEKYGFRLDEAIERGKANQRQLLKGWNIFVTEHIKGSEEYQELIKLNAGAPYLWKGRTSVSGLQKRHKTGANGKATEELEEDGDVLYLVSGTDEKDVALWEKFRKMAGKNGLKPRIVTNDWLSNGLLAQKMEWDAKYELSEENVNGLPVSSTRSR